MFSYLKNIVALISGLRDEARQSAERLQHIVAHADRAAATNKEDLLIYLWGQTGRYSDTKSLSRFDASVYSQNGEDGMIAEIFNRIGTKDKFFVEIGIGDGQQNNTRFLLEQGWSGLWIDGDTDGIARASDTFKEFISSEKLRIINSMISVDNINHVLESAGVQNGFDFLSLDIDQNTSHVWRSLQIKSRVSCLEYNASLPPSVSAESPYDETASWDGTNWFGGSLKAFETIGRQKNMRLVGCDLNGVNAFFVDERDAGDLFPATGAAEHHYEPPRYLRAFARRGHPPASSARNWV